MRGSSVPRSALTASAVSELPTKTKLSGSGTSFLDLPAELRNRIYHYALSVDYVELAPLGDKAVEAYHLQRLREDVVPRLRLLRVSQQLHGEAAPIYYGTNDFRFTGRSGHEIFAAFCHAIGRNTRFQRSVTVQIIHPAGLLDTTARWGLSSSTA